jgi:hypothetical protein
MLGWARSRFHRKHVGTRYAVLVFLHPVGSAGEEVHSGGAGAGSVNTLFFTLGVGRCGVHKKHAGYVTVNLCFCIRYDLRVT